MIHTVKGFGIVNIYIYILYMFFFRLFSIVGYYKILDIVLFF